MSEAQSAVEPAGTVYPLGRYLVLAGLGRGGMAEVYLALARGPSGFSKLVVLKLLREHLAEDQEFLTMFMTEARFAARLNHPNIVQTYEVGVENGRHCIVMEYLEGRSFSYLEAAAADQRIALNLGLRVLADTLAGLHHAHERCDEHGRPLGLVHRDVSPHNVFITYDGQVKVLDFGIAKAADDGAQTKTGVFKGKLRYTAPERFSGDTCDRRADIFSVGVMLWQLLTRRRLWSGLTDLALMQQLANNMPVPSPRTVDPAVPAELERICMKALAASPDNRFQTALEMQDALEEFLSGDSVGGTNRALGKFMGDVFREKRAEFQRVVDEQTRAAADVPLDIELTGSVARLRAQRLPVLGSEGEAEGAISMRLPPSGSRIRALDVGTMTGSGPSVVASIEVDSAPLPFMRRRWVRRVGFGAVIAIVVTAIILLRGSPTSEPSMPTAGPAAILAPVGPRLNPGTLPAAAAAPEDRVQDPPGGTPSVVVPIDVSPTKRAAATISRPALPVRPRTSPAPVEAHPTVSGSETPAKHEIDCTSPYFIDEQGMKKVRVECL